MLILQKNSFKLNDGITNAGFAISLALIMLVFLIVPVILVMLGIVKYIPPLLHILLPSLLIIPGICITMYFVGKPGNLLRKFKMVNLHPEHISVSFIATIIVLFTAANVVYVYHKILKVFYIEIKPPPIEQILKGSDSISLWLMCFGIIVLAPISEEIIFRRFIFAYLAPRGGFISAMLLTASLFAVIHMSLYSLPALFLLGIGFQLIYLKFGSLYPAILMHSFNNAIAVALLLFWKS